jgi:hypothetical protein
MKRRDFLAVSCVAGMVPLGQTVLAEDACKTGNKEKYSYELRRYRMASKEKRDALEKYLAGAAIPAWGRLGIGPVGVFVFHEEEKDQSPDVFVLLPAKCAEVLLAANTQMMADAEYVKAAADLLGAPKDDPVYQRIESALLLAFDGCPKPETPTKKESRVFQLRIYESHNEERAKKKIAMFNEGGEIALFRKVGMPPVFFGETLVGEKVPNLTYMLGFDDMDAKKAGWDAFLASEEWAKLKNDPQYKDTVSNITNIVLRPAACSQI